MCTGPLQLPLQPTLSGLLLGYPVVYHVHSRDHAQQAQRALASTDLVLLEAHATLGAGTGTRTGSGGCTPRTSPGCALPLSLPLCACSLPAELCSAADLAALVAAWQARLQGAVAVWPGLWTCVAVGSRAVGVQAVVL